MVKIHQHVKFQAIPSMRFPQMPGNLSGRTDWRTDSRTCRKTVTVGQVDQQTHVQVKWGYFRLQTDGRTDGQPENIMPPAPKGGGIKINQIIGKNNILWLAQNPGFMLISVLSAPTEPNLNALAWKKKPQEWPKCKKTVSGSKCAYLMSCDQGWGQVLFEVLESSTIIFFIFASTSTSSSTQSTWKTSSTSSNFSIKYKSSTSTLVTNNSTSHSTADGLCY